MNINSSWKGVRLFAFDLDGTLYEGKKAIKGAPELIEFLRSRYKVVFFTNNSSKTAEEVCDKLVGLGFSCTSDEMYTATYATAMYLKSAAINNIYVVGSKSFKQELKNAGLSLKEDSSAKNLVVGLDFEFNYEKAATALAVLNKGGKFVVCNADRSFPSDGGIEKPGCGAMVGAIAVAANRNPDFLVGKPNTYILKKIAQDNCVTNKEIIVVGDSFESDIQMALNFKCKSVLIGKNKTASCSVTTVKDIIDLHKYARRVMR